MKSRFTALMLVGMIGLVAPCISHAGLYTDDLSRCLVKNTSDADRSIFVRWIYAMMALHPDVASLSTTTPAQRDALSQQTADIMTRLITESCKSEAKDAIKYEGPSSFGTSFGILGQVAMTSLMSHPEVQMGLQGFAKHLDRKKIQAAFGSDISK